MQSVSSAVDLRSASAQALDILRATSDGVLLAHSDFGLLQFAVNHGRDAMSPAFAARWDYLVSSTVQGCYEPPWFHGVQNLTTRQDGCVLWRDQVIEHYSFDDVKAEQASAEQLGACCRLIEHRGEKVNRNTLNGIWQEAQLGAGLDRPRWLVVWSSARLSAGAAVRPIPGADVQNIMDCRVAALEQEALERQCGAQDSHMRSLMVVTVEDRQGVIDAIVGDKDWDLRMRPMCDKNERGGRYDSMIKSVCAQIDGNRLPTRAQVWEQILEPVRAVQDVQGCEERERG